MAEAEAGLELPIGLTEQKFVQQLARIEARAIKAAKSAEQGFVRGNQAVANSFSRMSGAARGNLQNVSYQLQDIFVQISSGQGVARALGQQMPQLLSGFGALGAALGTVAAIGVPLAASFMSSGEEAVDLEKQVKALSEALEALRDAQANAAMPIDVLIEKYGALGDEMSRVFQNQLAIARQEMETLGASIQAAINDATNISDMVARFDALKLAVDAGVISYDEYRNQLRDVETQFGLTVAQALQYQNLMEQVASAQGPDQQASAWLAVHDWISANSDELLAQGVNVDDLVKRTNDLAASYGEAHGAASEITSAAEAGAVATDNWAAMAANLAANMDGAAAAAGRAAAAVGAAIAAQNQRAGMNLGQIGGLDVFGPSAGRVITDLAGGTSLQEQGVFDRDWQARVEAAEKRAREAQKRAGKSGRSGSGRRGGKEKEAPNVFESAEREIQQLERQIELIGKSNQEVAAAEARWAMLDAAKRAGVPVNDQLNSQIDAQAEKVGQLTAQLEQAEASQQQFDQAVEGIANAFSNAILQGENLRDSLAQIFRQIAANILNAGIQQALAAAFGGGGSGLMGFIAAAFGGTKAATPVFGGARATGGGVRAGSAYLVNENTPRSEVFVPSMNGAVLNVQQAQAALRQSSGGANGGTVDVRVFVDENGNWQAAVERISGKVSAQMVAGNNRAQQDRQYLRNGR